jgi:G2/mitotic-specific cyclin-B2
VTAAEPLKRTSKLTNLTEVKTDNQENRGSSNEMQLIRSPGSYKGMKTVKVEHVQPNFYESHSMKLLHQVDNIDENDGENPQLLAEYVQDIYAYLFKLENIFPIRENFLANQVDVTPKMRSVLLDWINEVHNQFSLELETFHMTVSMIDRYLQANPSTPRRYLQLVGVTALFMASKYEELMPPEISDFVYVTGKRLEVFRLLRSSQCAFILRRHLQQGANPSNGKENLHWA